MSALDWIVLVGTLAFIVIYGFVKTRDVKSVDDYLIGDRTLRWPTIGLSIMATQASAITFLSTPGQAFEDGMRFVQFYFGQPLAMVLISAVFVPIFQRLNVFTAYEYLEHRFDARVRALGAMLFLVQRGLSAGITLYAPSIILSSILGWPLELTNVGAGALVVLYTVTGGTRAVSQTQKQQMIVMLSGMAIAGIVIVHQLPEGVSVASAVRLAGALGRMNVVSFSVDFADRYNFWSGITGGFFLALAYFGTDQSQVQRYLSGRSVVESRLGLLFNGLFKVPMQFAILFVGVLVFVFYLFTKPPLFFDAKTLDRVASSRFAPELAALEAQHAAAFSNTSAQARRYVRALEGGEDLSTAKAELSLAFRSSERVKRETRDLIRRALPDADGKDGDHVFLSFVIRYLPRGLVGLLVAVILCAAMSSISSELAALGSTTTVDLYRRFIARAHTPARDLSASKLFTVAWGLFAITFALFASRLGNLVEAVNILGSLFYGTTLGLFLVGFFLRSVSATPVLIAAFLAESVVVTLFFRSSLGFLWFNVVGCGVVVVGSLVFEAVLHPRRASA